MDMKGGRHTHLYGAGRGKARDLIAAIAVFLALATLFLLALSFLTRQNDAREARLLERALKRAIVTCYAIEGRYPPDLTYIRECYGVTYDASRYAVRYEAFASNVMPRVRVTRLGGGA